MLPDLPTGLSWWFHRLPNLDVLLDTPLVYRPFSGKKLAAVAGWGRKKSFFSALKAARRRQIPCLTLEDGFLRSVGLGQSDPPLSIIVDDIGIYYDAARPSRLEESIRRPFTDEERHRALSLIAKWREGRVSKYNHLRDPQRELPDRFVLVADQTRGDASIRYGLAAPESFRKMLQAAMDENPGAVVLVKIHPDVFAGKKQGYFSVAELESLQRVQVLADDVHPVTLLERAEAVYCVTSQIGFEALLWGKKVRTFGAPFYAGWGLTDDDLPAPPRRQPVPLEHLVHAALIDYPRYINPETGRRCEVETVLDHLARQRRMRGRFPETVYALGFSPWKKPIVRDYFGGSTVLFRQSADAVPDGATVALWGRKPYAGTLAQSVEVIHLEDGFLRSVGLGADLIRPLSWVMDRRGIYYDATGVSDLEILLQNSHFDDDLVTRAGLLRERIVNAGLTKYNVGSGCWLRPPGAARVILVPGQVENDASIRFGAPGISTNIDLLKAVRRANPDAFILYKPHPDVLAGLRSSGVGEDEAAAQCDEIVEHADMSNLLAQVDEVHVMTSLAGFEALLRGLKVETYGRPFYSGWGLTVDHAPLSRRERTLLLDELVAAALILYPVYVSRLSGCFSTPEQTLDDLDDWRKEKRGARLSLWQRFWRKMVKSGVVRK